MATLHDHISAHTTFIWTCDKSVENRFIPEKKTTKKRKQKIIWWKSPDVANRLESIDRRELSPVYVYTLWRHNISENYKTSKQII